MPPYKLDKKFLEILVNLVRDQNVQLMDIIAEEENISRRELSEFIPTRFMLKKMLVDMETSTKLQ